MYNEGGSTKFVPITALFIQPPDTYNTASSIFIYIYIVPKLLSHDKHSLHANINKMNSSFFQFSPLQASGRFIPSVSGALILCSTHKLLPVRPLQLNNKAKIHPAAKTSGKEDEGKILISIKPLSK